jgi:hypothetical protein
LLLLLQVLNMRDPRQLGEGLNPRALRAVKDTVRGMRVAYRCPTGTVRNKLVREVGTRGANQVGCVGAWVSEVNRTLHLLSAEAATGAG